MRQLVVFCRYVLAKKIKALELNQSMFDRYIEALNVRYADRFEDLAGDVSDLEDRVVNSTAVAAAAVGLAEDRAAATAGACERNVAVAAAAAAAAAASHEAQLRAVHAAVAASSAAWRAYFGVSLGCIAGLLGLVAAGTAAQAAVAAGMGGGGGAMAAHVLMLGRVALTPGGCQIGYMEYTGCHQLVF
jgi:hypothetical protein